MTEKSESDKEAFSSDIVPNDSEEDQGETPLMEAARWGYYDHVQKLLNDGASVDATTEEEWTALHAACVGQHCDIIQLLIANKANPNIYSYHRHFDEEFGWHFSGTPLHVAAANGSVQVAEILLAAGALISAASGLNQTTPIFYAAAYGHAEVIACLCKSGANPNLRVHRHEHGYFLDFTPLHYAARNGHLKAVEVLLSFGAEPRAVESQSKKTALQMAKENDHNDVVKLLRLKQK